MVNPAYTAQASNPFLDDRFGYTLLSHTDLSRDTGKAGDIDLANFKWRNFDMVVIDESHNFRNDSKPRTDEGGRIRHSRYSRLLEEIIKAGPQTKVLMLSATPVNTSLIDLRNQIYLMTEKREDVFRESLGIGHIGNLLRQTQKAFKTWESKADKDGKKDKTKLLETLGTDFFKLLGGVSIARSRQQKDTARYLYENLADLANELELNMAMVSGDVTRTMSGANNFNAILTNFAPCARGRTGSTDEVDLLIATDCISEGQNLQDCDTVLNYDIHWNPVRIIQRFGRIDRIGSRNQSVRMVNYWPTRDMDVYLHLQSRVQARMALADATASGDDDPLNEDPSEQIQMELNFRDEQLKKMREEVLDLDELSDGVVMSDFTLDYFFAQLLRYLEQNREELEAMPYGAYAVTDEEGDTVARPGAIFFLRQRNASTDNREKRASPIHPYYVVYIRDNGDIRYGCANARHVLELFESVAVGKTKPLQRLCDQFDRETRDGQDMARYNKLLNAVIAHIDGADRATHIRQLGINGQRDFRLPVQSANSNNSDFELVTWLVVLDAQAGNRTT